MTKSTINFTQRLLTYDGEPMIQNEVSYDDKGEKVITPFEMTIQRCAKFALLDVARFEDGRANPLNSPESMYLRYKLMRRIDENPKSVEMTQEEKDIFFGLLPTHYEVIIVGQIMDLMK